MKIKANLALLVFALPAVAFATEYQTVERPRQECWNEQVPVQQRGDDAGAAIIGGIAGGLLRDEERRHDRDEEYRHYGRDD
jgi:uncharacterized protein YcfJ